MIFVNSRKIEFNQTGEGPAVLFLPGSYSTSAAWTGIRNRLPENYCFVSTSLCGYGQTQETRGENDMSIHHQVENLEAIADKIAAPIHLVGHSYGGAVTFASALAKNFDIASITTFEANPISVLLDWGRPDLFEVCKDTAAKFTTAFHAGDRDAAGIIIDFWGGEGAFGSMPDVVKEYCRTTVISNVYDWHGTIDHNFSRSGLTNLEMPVLLVRGEFANPVMVEITRGLQSLLPNATSKQVAGAGHFLINSHAGDCAQLLGKFLEEIA